MADLTGDNVVLTNNNGTGRELKINSTGTNGDKLSLKAGPGSSSGSGGTGGNVEVIGGNAGGTGNNNGGSIVLTPGTKTGSGLNGKLEVVGTSLFNGTSANLDPAGGGGNINFLQNSAKMLLGWNRTGGEGEADFINNRGAGSKGGFAFYDYDNSGNSTQMVRIACEGSATVFKSAAGVLYVVPQTLNSSGINAAINYARLQSPKPVVFLPAGTYTIDSQITVYEGIQLIGAGFWGTILDASNFANDVIVSESITHGASGWLVKNHIVLRDFKVIGNTSTPRYRGIYLQGVANSIIEKVWIVGGKIGIHVKGWVNSVINCLATSCYMGYNLSWHDATYPDTTNQVSLRGVHCEGGTLTPPTAIAVSSASYNSTNKEITFSTATNHNLSDFDVAAVSGCTPTPYNGVYCIRVTDATHFRAVKLADPGVFGSGGTVTLPIIGVYANGIQNSIIASTIERRADNTSVAESYGIFLDCMVSEATPCSANYFPSLINGCYFEGWKNTFALSGCRGCVIQANFYTVFDSGYGIVWDNNADMASKQNSLIGNAVNRFTWNGGTSTWDLIEMFMYGEQYLGRDSDTYVSALKLVNSNNPAAGTHGVGIDLQLSADYSDYKKAEIRAIATSGYANDIALTFWSGGSVSTKHQERMRIDSGGNVGINLSNPAEKLDVSGNVKSNGYFMLGNVKIGTGPSLPFTSDSNWKFKGCLFITSGGAGNGKLYINTAADNATIIWTVVGSQS
jgi:hypothetical protein